MDFAIWSLLVGALLIVMALGTSVLARLPLSTAMLYLLAGVAIGPLGLGLLWATPDRHTLLIERLTEVVVLVSLFTAGLKLSPPLNDRRWWLPLRLALTSMVLTVLAISAVGWLLLGLVLNIGLIDPLGFIPASVLLFACTARAFGSRRPLRDALIGFVLSAIAYFGFSELLGINIGAGFLGASD